MIKIFKLKKTLLSRLQLARNSLKMQSKLLIITIILLISTKINDPSLWCATLETIQRTQDIRAIIEQLNEEDLIILGEHLNINQNHFRDLVLDALGNTVQNPNKGGQWMAVFDKPRIVSKDVKHLYETDIEAQAYVDQHENTIKAHIDKSRTQHSRNLPKQIGGQDDEPLS